MKVDFISDLLYRHDCVIIPGFGGFLTSYVPARIDRETNRFYPPSCKLAFNANLSVNDGLLANHISKVTGVTYREASEDIRKWVEMVYRQLQSGQRYELPGIGVMSLNIEGNLLFDPTVNTNFLGNSFGLPSFTAQPVQEKSERHIVEDEEKSRPIPSRLRHLIPETLKWAAVLVPFIAFGIWGATHTESLDNYIHNYTGFYSWVRSTPGKTSSYSAKSVALPVKNEKKDVLCPSSILKANESHFSPILISHPKTSSRTSEVSAEKVSLPAHPNDAHYHIIGGAFKEHSNALKLIAELQSKGYPSSIIDITAKGMYVVSIKGYISRNDAMEALASIKSSGYSEAWVMHKP